MIGLISKAVHPCLRSAYVWAPHLLPQDEDDGRWWWCRMASVVVAQLIRQISSVPQSERRTDATSMWRGDMDKATNDPRDADSIVLRANCRGTYHSDEESGRTNSGENRSPSYRISAQVPRGKDPYCSGVWQQERQQIRPTLFL